MRKSLALAAVALALSGCASMPGGSPVSEQILQNLEGCKRTYIMSLGGLMPPAGSLHIECAAQEPPAP